MNPHLAIHLEISALLARERNCRDTHQWARQRAAWHPDASQTYISISWFNGDVDEFVSRSKTMVSGGIASRHSLTVVETHFHRPSDDADNTVIGDKAVAECVGNIMFRVKIADSEYDVTSWGRFFLGVKNVPGVGWRFVSLETIYDRDSIVPTCPGQKQVEIITDGMRESYKYLTWVLGTNGYTIPDDLPGTDRPESAEKVIERQRTWLEGKY